MNNIVLKRNNSHPLVSVIIPLHWGLKKENYKRFLDDFNAFLVLDYDNYEIVLVTDRKIKLPFKSRKIKYITTNKTTFSPTEKRDFALKHVKGEVCAFIDDDAYPDKNWIKNAVKNFRDNKIVAVGGPGVTPPKDTFWEKIGGYIIESYFGSGKVQYRFYNKPKRKLFVDDYPAYNLFIRTDILKKVGGYGSTFYGGEDTYLCLKLIKKGLILYDSEAVVFHHRRSFPLDHLKQIASVGIHRGYFFKKYPETSRNLFYLLPTFLTLGILIAVLLAITVSRIFINIFLALFMLAIIAGTLSVKSHNAFWISSIISGFGIIVNHITYGIFFIKGLLITKLIN